MSAKAPGGNASVVVVCLSDFLLLGRRKEHELRFSDVD